MNMKLQQGMRMMAAEVYLHEGILNGGELDEPNGAPDAGKVRPEIRTDPFF